MHLCPKTVGALPCFYLAAHLTLAQLSSPSRSSLGAEQHTDVASLHPRDAKTLFCFHHHGYSSYFMPTATQKEVPCVPLISNAVSLSWDGFGQCQRDDGQTHRQHRQLSQQKMLSLPWPKGPDGVTFSNTALHKVNRMPCSAARVQAGSPTRLLTSRHSAGTSAEPPQLPRCRRPPGSLH